MPKLETAAQLIEELYYNGHHKVNDSKLQYDDFLQYLIIAAGGIMRNQFYEQIQLDGEAATFLSSMVDIEKHTVLKLSNGIKVVDSEVMPLPRNMGILNVYPVLKDCDEEEPDYERSFMRIGPGEQRYYTKKVRDDLGKDTFSMRGVRPLLGTEEEEVFVELIKADNIETMEMPFSVVRAALSEVLVSVLKLGDYIDMTDDRDPNVKRINERLKSAA